MVVGQQNQGSNQIKLTGLKEEKDSQDGKNSDKKNQCTNYYNKKVKNEQGFILQTVIGKRRGGTLISLCQFPYF